MIEEFRNMIKNLRFLSDAIPYEERFYLDPFIFSELISQLEEMSINDYWPRFNDKFYIVKASSLINTDLLIVRAGSKDIICPAVNDSNIASLASLKIDQLLIFSKFTVHNVVDGDRNPLPSHWKFRSEPTVTEALINKSNKLPIDL